MWRREFASKGVRLFRQQARRGKTAGLNAFVPALHGDVIVFSDANAMYDPQALRMLVRNFGDPAVGCVTGEARYLSGNGTTDAARIALLVELAVDFSIHHMKPEGALVVKLFHGGAYDDLVALFRQTFKVVKPIKPKSSRDKSSETFLVGMGLK